MIPTSDGSVFIGPIIKNPAWKRRFKSFLWRSGMMLLAASVDIIAQNLMLLELPNTATVVIGLVLGEVSKHLNRTDSPIGEQHSKVG